MGRKGKTTILQLLCVALSTQIGNFSFTAAWDIPFFIWTLPYGRMIVTPKNLQPFPTPKDLSRFLQGNIEEYWLIPTGQFQGIDWFLWGIFKIAIDSDGSVYKIDWFPQGSFKLWVDSYGPLKNSLKNQSTGGSENKWNASLLPAHEGVSWLICLINW